MPVKRIVIVGSGFGGLNAAKGFAGQKQVEVTIIDRNNYHLFQPLLYQVAMAGLSPADISVPIRSIFSGFDNIRVLKAEALLIEAAVNHIRTDIGRFPYDYLILACGARHTYFAHEEWEGFAPGLKTIEQATEIRRRVLCAFEMAEAEPDAERRNRLLTFVVVGGGSTGVELTGALAELSRFTLVKDFRNIHPDAAKIILLEAGPVILPSFPGHLADQAAKVLKTLGVEVKTSSPVKGIDGDGVVIAGEKIHASTVLWAAGIKASDLNSQLDGKTDAMGRVLVRQDLSLENHPEIFVIGDQANVIAESGTPLPAIAPVALQQGRFVAENILGEINGRSRKAFHYHDKGQMAAIGRRKAILQIKKIRLSGFIAWVAWLFIHIYYLIGFRNKLLVLFQWIYSYATYKKGARLILNKTWRFYRSDGDGFL